jgi:hypothetical protein
MPKCFQGRIPIHCWNMVFCDKTASGWDVSEVPAASVFSVEQEGKHWNLSTKRVEVAITLYTRIWVVLSWNLGPDFCCPD